MEINRSGEMEVFVHVVQAGSFSAAARKLHMTPSAVAKLVARLEARLGIRLVNRTTRSLQLTTEGKGFFDSARGILADIEEAENSITAKADLPRGLLRVTASISFGHHVLIPILPDFLNTYPDISIDLNLTDSLINILEERTDIAIRHGELKNSGLIARKLGDSQHLLAASPAYIERHGLPLQPADLLNHNCLDFNFKQSLSEWRFTRNTHEETIPISGNVKINNGETLRQLTLAGLGISRLSHFHVAKDLRQGRLIEVLADYNSGESKPIHAIYHSRNHIPARLRALIDYLARHMAISEL